MIPFIISILLYSMLTTINFQDQSPFETYEIHNISPDWLLPPNSKSFYLFSPQMLP